VKYFFSFQIERYVILTCFQYIENKISRKDAKTQRRKDILICTLVFLHENINSDGGFVLLKSTIFLLIDLL